MNENILFYFSFFYIPCIQTYTKIAVRNIRFIFLLLYNPMNNNNIKKKKKIPSVGYIVTWKIFRYIIIGIAKYFIDIISVLYVISFVYCVESLHGIT